MIISGSVLFLIISVGLRFSSPNLHLVLGYVSLHPTYRWCWVTFLSTQPTGGVGLRFSSPNLHLCWVTFLSTQPTGGVGLRFSSLHLVLGYVSLHPTYLSQIVGWVITQLYSFLASSFTFFDSIYSLG